MSWPLIELQDFCRTGSGTTPSRAHPAYYEGTIPWVKSGELRESTIYSTSEHISAAALQETSLKLVPKGALLVAMYGATVGRVGVLGIEATTNQAVCHVVPDPSKADTTYMFHLLQAKAAELVSRGVGGAQPNISQGIIKSLKIPLPPLEEQKRIAGILDQADALRRLRTRALDKLNSLGQAIFHEMFGDPLKEQRSSPDWTLEILDESIRYIDYRGKTPPKAPNGIRLITAKNVKMGYINPEPMEFIDEEAFPEWMTRGFPKKGDVLFTTEAPLGNVAILDSDQTLAVGQRLLTMQPDHEKIVSE